MQAWRSICAWYALCYKKVDPTFYMQAMPNSLKQRQVKTKRPTHGDVAPRLPHERDESDDSQASPPRKVMRQAYQDVENGLVDTDLRGSLGVDEATRAKHNSTEPSPPSESRNRDPNTQKMPDGR
jgi:hypothetical protein